METPLGRVRARARGATSSRCAAASGSRAASRSSTRPATHRTTSATSTRSTGDAFVGDVGGVRIPPHEYVVPPTPPPDIDVEAWLRSLDVIASHRPRALCLTHFGRYEDVGEHIDRLREELTLRAEKARTLDSEAFERLGHGRGPPTPSTPSRSARCSRRRRPSTCTPACAATGTSAPSARPRRPPDERHRRAAAHVRPRLRPRRQLARDRPERRPQHLRRSSRGARALRPRHHARQGLRDRRPDPHTGQAIVWTGHQASRPSTTGSSCTTRG